MKLDIEPHIDDLAEQINTLLELKHNILPHIQPDEQEAAMDVVTPSFEDLPALQKDSLCITSAQTAKICFNHFQDALKQLVPFTDQAIDDFLVAYGQGEERASVYFLEKIKTLKTPLRQPPVEHTASDSSAHELCRAALKLLLAFTPAEEGVSLLLCAAELGDARAQEMMAAIDEERALFWRIQAAHADDAKAQTELGQFLVENKHTLAAFQWFSRAAAFGYPAALFHLGVFYQKGSVVDLNLEKSLEYYAWASLQGCLPAVHNAMHLCEQDPAKKYQYKRLLAEKRLGSHEQEFIQWNISLTYVDDESRIPKISLKTDWAYVFIQKTNQSKPTALYFVTQKKGIKTPKKITSEARILAPFLSEFYTFADKNPIEKLSVALLDLIEEHTQHAPYGPLGARFFQYHQAMCIKHFDHVEALLKAYPESLISLFFEFDFKRQFERPDEVRELCVRMTDHPLFQKKYADNLVCNDFEKLKEFHASILPSKISSQIINRPLSKLAAVSEIRHQAGAQNRSVHVVHEDSSTALMPNSATAVEFRKRSNVPSFFELAPQDQHAYCELNKKYAERSFAYFKQAIDVPERENEAIDAFLNAYMMSWHPAHAFLNAKINQFISRQKDAHLLKFFNPQYPLGLLHKIGHPHTSDDTHDLFYHALRAIFSSNTSVQNQGFSQLLEAAQKNHACAQTMIACLYCKLEPQNILTQYWLLNATLNNDANAYATCMQHYSEKISLSMMRKKLHFFANEGHSEALFCLGQAYGKESEMGQKYYQLSAMQLNLNAIKQYDHEVTHQRLLAEINNEASYFPQNIPISFQLNFEHREIQGITPHSAMAYIALMHHSIPTLFFVKTQARVTTHEPIQQAPEAILALLEKLKITSSTTLIESLSTKELCLIESETNHSPYGTIDVLSFRYHQAMYHREFNTVLSLMLTYPRIKDLFFDFEFRHRWSHPTFLNKMYEFSLFLKGVAPTTEIPCFTTWFYSELSLLCDEKSFESDFTTYLNVTEQLLTHIDWTKIIKPHIEPMLKLVIHRWITMYRAQESTPEENRQWIEAYVMPLLHRAYQHDLVIEDSAIISYAGLIFYKSQHPEDAHALWGDMKQSWDALLAIIASTALENTVSEPISFKP